jgi:NADP-dependent 3-hydroxy acid dehydrogenase YdfG
MDRVKGKVAIVTGGAGGLGRAQAVLLAKEGASVVITDVDESSIKKVSEEIRTQGGNAIYAKHDVTRETEWDGIMRRTLEEFGRLDVLVNNAGVILYKKITDTSLAEWHKSGDRNHEKIRRRIHY